MTVLEHPSGRDALQLLERAIAAKPLRDGRALSEAVSRLATFRDMVIEAHRARRRLSVSNHARSDQRCDERHLGG